MHLFLALILHCSCISCTTCLLNHTNIQETIRYSLASSCSRSRLSRRSLTSWLYSLAILTSVVVICSRKNSKSTFVFSKLVCAVVSLSCSSCCASFGGYDSIVFAYGGKRFNVSQRKELVVKESGKDVLQAIRTLPPLVRWQLSHIAFP